MVSEYWPDVYNERKYMLHVFAENDYEARKKITIAMFRGDITPQVNQMICEWINLGQPLGKRGMPELEGGRPPMT